MHIHPMQQYHTMLRYILQNGVRRPNRTGVDTLFVPGYMLKFDMADGFPVPTTRKFAFKAARGELLGFLRGYRNAEGFRHLGCHVWDANANSNVDWLKNPNRMGTDDLGRIYGVQWNDWTDYRVISSVVQFGELRQKGYRTEMFDSDNGVWLMRRGINQLENALRTILTNPTDRRIIITAWRPDEFDQMALPPCHVDYQFLVDTVNRKLHLTMWQRSYDTVLGFNIQLCAMFLEIMSRLSGYQPGTVTHFISDAHIYVNHIDGVRQMLDRELYPLPKLILSEDILPVELDQVTGAFKRIAPDDLTLTEYQSNEPIKFEMAV